MPERKLVPASWQRRQRWKHRGLSLGLVSPFRGPRSSTTFHAVSIMKWKLCTSALTPRWPAGN